MTKNFPYTLLNSEMVSVEMNRLATLRLPFLFVIDFDAKYGYVIENNEINTDFIHFQFNSIANFESENTPIDKTINWNINPIPYSIYQTKFDFVQQQIRLGNSFLTNLTQPTVIDTNYTLSMIYNMSYAPYKLWFRDKMLVLSPEKFVQINDGIISSFPMKGTIDASILNAEHQILNDTKEMAEHATIVDLIRNDLSIVAENVEVKRYRYIEKIKTMQKNLLQVSSEISGRLPENYHSKLGDIIFQLLPAGSICGAPKAKTLEIIHQIEGYERGFYTGICGYFNGENLDSAVMIRYIEQNGDNLIFKSGGGITSKSDCNSEYNELIQKVYVPIR